MKLERLPEYLTTTLILLCGIGFALFCGMEAGAGEFKILGLTAFIVSVVACWLILRARVWLLIPFAWTLTGKIPVLPLPFSVRDLAVLMAAGGYGVFYALKIVRTKVRFGWIDTLVLFTMVYLGTVYLRNPVGVEALRSAQVGGRPYLDVFIAFVAYSVLRRVPGEFSNIQRFPFYMLGGAALAGLAGLLVQRFPSLGLPLGAIYSDLDTTGVEVAGDIDTRYASLQTTANLGFLLLASYFPVRTLLLPRYPLRVAALFGSSVALLFSGFRSSLVVAGAALSLGSYFRRQLKQLALLGALGVLIVAIAALGNGRIFKLPFAVQRTLSFLPGEWDYEVTGEATGSVDWRTDMWRIVVTENKWIENKWLGDGFGFSRSDLLIMQKANMVGGTGFIGGATQEAQLITGAFHNGPLSTIRYAGVAGLVLLLALMISQALHAARTIRRLEKSALFPSALFIGIPLIMAPFTFVLVYGAYDGALESALFSAGLMEVLIGSYTAAQALAAAPETLPVPDTALRPVRQPESAGLGHRIHSRF